MVPFTNIPFFSAFFLVLVGVLIGNLIWYRFRDEQEQSQYRLRVKNRRLTSAIEHQTADIERVESEWGEATEELSSLKALVQTLQHEKDQWLLERERTAVQLAQERQARQDLEICLRDESQKISITDSEREALAERLSQQDVDWEDLQRQFEKTNQQLLESNLQAERRTLECRELEHHLEDACARQEAQAQVLCQTQDELQKTRHVLVEQRDLTEQQQATLRQMEHKQANVEAMQIGIQEELNQLKHANVRLLESCDQSQQALSVSDDALARSMDEVAMLRSQLLSFETRHDEVVCESEASARRECELKIELEDLADHRARSQHQLVAAEDHARRLETELRVERDRHLSLQYAHTQLQNTQERWQQNNSELQHRCSLVLAEAGLSEQNWQQRLADLQTHYGTFLLLTWNDTQHRLNHFMAEAKKWQADFERVDRQRLTASQQRDDREMELNRLESIEEQFLQRGAELQQLKRETRDVRHQLEQAMEVEAATRDVVKSLRDELNECLVDVERLREEITVRDEALLVERRRREALEVAAESAFVNEQRFDLVALTAQRTEESLAARLIDRASEVHRLEQVLADWVSRCRYYQGCSELAENRLDELMLELDRQKQLSDQMQRRRFGTLDQSAVVENMGALSFREMRSKELMRRFQDEQKLRNDDEMGKVFDEPPLRPDDLTKIPTIDRRLQRSLNNLGIYTYRQIAGWDAQAVQVVGDRLQIGKDICRNDWVGHARRLSHDEQRSIA